MIFYIVLFKGMKELRQTCKETFKINSFFKIMKFLISTSSCIQCYVFILEKKLFYSRWYKCYYLVLFWFIESILLFKYSSCIKLSSFQSCYLHISRDLIHFHVAVLVLSIFPTHVFSHICTKYRNQHFKCSLKYLQLFFWLLPW